MTVSFQESTLSHLDALVPKYKRSRFINSAVVVALQQRAKEQTLDALESMEKFDVSEKDLVNTLQAIREDASSRLNPFYLVMSGWPFFNGLDSTNQCNQA